MFFAPSFRRPSRKSSSMTNDSAATVPPNCSTSEATAAAVPPVASTSSTISTRWPGWMAS